MTMLAIHKSNSGFHSRWVKYCEEQKIPFKFVDCHSVDIVKQLRDCDGLLWHHSHWNAKDLLVAKSLLSALEHTGFKVFPDWRTGWHFDDKLAQRYLFEAIGARIVPTWVFLDKQEALDWVEYTKFPKVFKLRGGAGSSNVCLVKNKADATKLIRQAFGKGFENYNAMSLFRDRWSQYCLGKIGYVEVLKGLARFLRPPAFASLLGKEIGYVYFQEFMPNNDSDTRVIVIDNKAFALKRFVRKGDFRASGSGHFAYDQDEFDQRCVQMSFEITERLDLQCAAYDFVFDADKNPLLVEVSYGFSAEGYDLCPGYWDSSMRWHQGPFNPQGWMVESLIQHINFNPAKRKEKSCVV